eukprot:366501-Chlamydomonas_euryale.AAC.12
MSDFEPRRACLGFVTVMQSRLLRPSLAGQAVAANPWTRYVTNVCIPQNRLQVISELRELVSQKDHLMSSITSDFSTPLKSIVDLSNVLLAGENPQLPQAAADIIGNIRVSGKRLLGIVTDVITANSLRTGTFELKFQPVNLRALASDTVLFFEDMVQPDVSLVNQLQFWERLSELKADPRALRQILKQLVGNACKFTNHGVISISASEHDDELVISVADTGAGIEQAKLDEINQCFQNGASDVSGMLYDGNGMGLRLVKALVEAHGGSVRVTSHVGSGSTFSFGIKIWQHSKAGGGLDPETSKQRPAPAILSSACSRPGWETLKCQQDPLPLCPTAPALHLIPYLLPVCSAPQTMQHHLIASSCAAVCEPHDANDGFAKPIWPWKHAGSCSDRGPIRVLSVDDEPVNQIVVENILPLEDGFEVVTAMNGEEALKLLEEAHPKPDVVLLDVMMPGMGGFDVCRTIRQQPLYGCLPVILVSANGSNESMVQGLLVGANDYITKPLGRQEIRARIASQLAFRDSVRKSGEQVQNGFNLSFHVIDWGAECGNRWAPVPLKCLLMSLSSAVQFDLTGDMSVVTARVTCPSCGEHEKQIQQLQEQLQCKECDDSAKLSPSNFAALEHAEYLNAACKECAEMDVSLAAVEKLLMGQQKNMLFLQQRLRCASADID